MGGTQGDLKGVRIAVVGAGVVGAAVSYRLAEAGAEVTIVERHSPGAGTSGSTFAWLNSFNKSPKPYHELNRTSIRDHRELAAELGGDWLHLDGLIQWADAGAAASELDEKVERLRQWGMTIDELSPRDVVRDLEPELSIDENTVERVYRVENEGWLDGGVMARTLVNAVQRRFGATFEVATVTGMSSSGGKVSSITLDNGSELGVDVVINSAGPQAEHVASLAGANVPLEPAIGMLLATSPTDVRIDHVVRCPQTNMRPYGPDTGQFLLHPPFLDDYAEEGREMPTDSPCGEKALQDAREIVPGLEGARIDRMPVGVRPIPRDGLPIVGFDEHVDGFYSTVTHSGITLSARLAVLVVQDLVEGSCDELDLYRPSRFSSARSREGEALPGN